MKTCQACMVAKAKQKNVTKVSDYVKSDKPGECMFFNIASFTQPRKGMVIPKPNWSMMVDENTNYEITYFFKKKDKIVKPTCELIKQLKYKGREMIFLRMDNAGENRILEKRYKSKDWQFVMEFEYTARAAPQHNHMAEMVFSTLGNKERALMVYKNIPVKYRYDLFREAFSTSTDLDGLVVVEFVGKRATRYDHMFEKDT
jgi:hypothetical protein